jgi:hypothetical protein
MSPFTEFGVPGADPSGVGETALALPQSRAREKSCGALS